MQEKGPATPREIYVSKGMVSKCINHIRQLLKKEKQNMSTYDWIPSTNTVDRRPCKFNVSFKITMNEQP